MTRGSASDSRGSETPALAAVRYVGLGIAVAVVLLAGCARPRAGVPPPPARLGDEETGLASWYGNPYHGRRTASGEVYDMGQMTAAHRTLPFGTWLVVENLTTGRTVEVRVNDRGPFVDQRILDLSYAAARVVGATGSGVIPVRLRVVAGPPPPSAQRDRAFAIQVGAFSAEERAVALQRELRGAGADARVQPAEVGGRTIYRVRVGRFANRADAVDHARRLTALGHAVLVVEE
jgi:rare lipoprotein A